MLRPQWDCLVAREATPETASINSSRGVCLCELATSMSISTGFKCQTWISLFFCRSCHAYMYEEPCTFLSVSSSGAGTVGITAPWGWSEHSRAHSTRPTHACERFLPCLIASVCSATQLASLCIPARLHWLEHFKMSEGYIQLACAAQCWSAAVKKLLQLGSRYV